MKNIIKKYVVVSMDAPESIFVKGFVGISAGHLADITTTLANALKFNTKEAAQAAKTLADMSENDNDEGWGVCSVIYVGGSWKIDELI